MDHDALARALWKLLTEDYLKRHGQSGMPAFTTYADTPPDIEEPCAFEEQSGDVQDWARWRAERIVTLYNAEFPEAAVCIGTPSPSTRLANSRKQWSPMQ